VKYITCHIFDVEKTKEVDKKYSIVIHNVIECTFRVCKKRWKLLQNTPTYPYKIQVQVIVVSMTLHNYIRIKTQDDNTFVEFDHHPYFIPD
jgi:hypothetical protein